MIVEGVALEAQSVLPSPGDAEESENSEEDKGGEENASEQQSSRVSTSTREHSDRISHTIRSLLNIFDPSQYPDIGQRDLAIILALSLMFENGSWNTTETRQVREIILHSVLLSEYRLCDRAMGQNKDPQQSNPFFGNAVTPLRLTINSIAWNDYIACNTLPCDMGDLLDGSVFHYLLDNDHVFEPAVIAKFNSRVALLEQFCNVSLTFKGLTGNPENASISEKSKKSAVEKQIFQPVLFFKHPVFDAHLTPVRLTVDEDGSEHINPETSMIFKELSHWHNHSRPVGAKSGVKMTEKQAFWANRRNQNFMAEMRDYAASLTNAVGAELQPESVFVQSSKGKASRQQRTIEPPPSKNKEAKRPTNSGKPGRKGNPPVNNVKDKAAAEREKKENEAKAKQLQAWGRMRDSYDKERNLVSRFSKAKEYLVRPSDQRAAIEAEVSVYLLNTLLEYWVSKCRAGERDAHLHIAALIWDMICGIAKMKESLTPEIAALVTKTTKALGLPDVSFDIVQSDKKSSTKHAQSSPLEFVNGVKVDIGIATTEFQLLHAAPFFDRNMGSAPDARVRDFEPDEWQRAVLDEIDANRSLFVVAPTSAGKTFIS